MRRFALTGTPLQNNLEEYFHMVNFVKPHLLGALKEYRNRFVNPITNGQYQNSQPSDINLMKSRSHILHKLLEGCVQRLDSTVLGSMLPKKHEFVIYIHLSKLQEELYRVCAIYRLICFTIKFIEFHNLQFYILYSQTVRKSGKALLSSREFFNDIHGLQRICAHSWVVKNKSDESMSDNDDSEESEEESVGEGTSSGLINLS